MLVCWVARLSIRQRASGATPCEVGAQAHESEVRDVKQRIVEGFGNSPPKQLHPSMVERYTSSAGFWSQTSSTLT